MQAKARFSPVVAAPELIKTWCGTAMQISTSLNLRLVELVGERVFQINDCGIEPYCR
jgi:hypothetical protein